MFDYRGIASKIAKTVMVASTTNESQFHKLKQCSQTVSWGNSLIPYDLMKQYRNSSKIIASSSSSDLIIKICPLVTRLF